MRHFFSTRVRVILIAALLIAVALAVIGGVTGLSIPDMLVKGVLTPIRSGVSRLSDQAQQIYSYIFKYESISAENEALKEELAQLQESARDAAATARENARLRALLELKEANESFQLVDGYIITRSSNEWTNTVTINSGSNVGIAVGMCAITANGELVGLVSEVGGNYAVVKTVLDTTLEISATIAASGYSGMVHGGYAAGHDGLLRMEYLPGSAAIRNNDQVVTAGSTVYPRNMILGYVADAGFDDTGVSKFALLRPAIDLGSLEQIFIVTEYEQG